MLAASKTDNNRSLDSLVLVFVDHIHYTELALRSVASSNCHPPWLASPAPGTQCGVLLRELGGHSWWEVSSGGLRKEKPHVFEVMLETLVPLKQQTGWACSGVLWLWLWASGVITAQPGSPKDASVPSFNTSWTTFTCSLAKTSSKQTG